MDIKQTTKQSAANVAAGEQVRQATIEHIKAIGAGAQVGAVFIIADGALPNVALKFSDGVTQNIKNLPTGNYVLMELTSDVLQAMGAPALGLFVFGRQKPGGDGV